MNSLRYFASFFALTMLAANGNNLFAQPGSAASVVTGVVQEREIREGMTFVGTVIPARTSDVGSAVDGRVVEFPIHLGQRVKKGDPLAQLLTALLEIELAGAQAELQAREAAAAEMKQARPEEIARVEAQFAGRKAAYDYALARWQRAQKLHEQRAFTEDQIEEMRSLAIVAQQLHLEAQHALDIAKKGERQEAREQALAKVEVQKQEVERIKDQLKKHTIRAPFDGYVAAEYTEAGQWLARGGLVAKIIELDHVDIEAAVQENYLPNIRMGTEATVSVAALPQQNLIGKVAEINPLGDTRTRNFIVHIRVDNPLVEDGLPLLKAGMFARATLSAGKTVKALLVPKDAVVIGGGPSPIVYVVSPDPKSPQTLTARAVPVQLGVALEGMFEVRGELKGGDQVVVQGNERLQPGAVVAELKTEAGG